MEVRKRSPADSQQRVRQKPLPRLCHLTPKAKAALAKSVDEMARDGLRVLGVAHATFKGTKLPDSQRKFKFTLAGLVGLADPLRKSVPAAVEECRTAGIKSHHDHW